MNKRLLLLGGLIFLGFLAKLFLIFGSGEFLLSNLIPDDSFYYFKTAQNILIGNGSTFDGVNPANGYHPLWMVLILPFFAIFDSGVVGDLTPIRGVLLFSSLLDVGTILVILSIIRKYTEELWVSILIASFWVFNPFIIYEVLSGLETSLSLFLIALSLLLLIRTYLEEENSYVLLGITGGLMMLARLDNLFYFLALLLFVFIYDKASWKRVLQIGLVATVIVLPWLVWNIAYFGSLLTSSSAAFTMYQHGLIVQDHGPSVLQKIKAMAYMAEHGFQTVLTQTGALVMALLTLGFGIQSIVLRQREKIRGLLQRPEFFFFCSWFLLFMLHTVVRLGYRTWYFISFNIFLTLVIAFIFKDFEIKDYIKNKLLRNIFMVATLLFVAFSFFVSWSQNLQGRERAQLEMLAMARWGNENLKEDVIIGAFNSGVQGYFSKHTVVNLDGLINQSAYEAMKNRSLWKYLKDQNITHLSDFDIYAEYRYRQYLGVSQPQMYLKPIHSISLFDHGRSGPRPGIHISEVLHAPISSKSY